MIVKIFNLTGDFAENKDIAKEVRIKKIIPVLEKSKEITVDFDKVQLATQSFIHALLSEPIREFGIEIIDSIIFKNCNDNIKAIIRVVVDYMQDSL
jgi:hypothetical protein